MTIALDHQRAALDLLHENGGSMRVQEVVTRAIMPSVQVRPVFTALIAAGKVRLLGDDLYVLARAVGPPQKLQMKVQEPQTPATAPAPAKPQEPEPVKAETKPDKEKRRCVRCEELLPLDQFPKRPGMVRAPRICVGCLPVDDTPGSPSDRERMGLPATRDQVPFRAPGPEAPPSPPNMETIKPLQPLLAPLARALSPQYVILEVEVHTTVRRHIEQLAATGLWGRTIEETAAQLIIDGVRKAILGDNARP